MAKTTETELKSLPQDIAFQLSAKRNDIVEVYIHRQVGVRAFTLGEFGTHEIVKGKNASEPYARGLAFLNGLRFK